MNAHELRMHWKSLPFREGQKFLDNMSDKDMNEIYSKISSVGIEIPTYEQFKAECRKYDGKEKCFVFYCMEPGEYEGGDARYFCAMCEKHAGVRGWYIRSIWRKAGVY